MKFEIIHTKSVCARRASNWVPRIIRRLPILAGLLLAISTKATIPTNFIGLDESATINGDLYLDTTATLNQMGVVTGTAFENQNLSTAPAAFGSNQTKTTNRVIGLASGKSVNRVPEPSELILTGFAALLLHLARRRFSSP